MKNNTNYFSHDCNARDDDKIMLLRSEYGWEGYGIRWLMIEKLSEATGYKLLLSNKLVISKLYVANIEAINYLFDIGLLAIEGEYMFSPSLLNRMQLKTEKKIKQSEGGKKAMENRRKSKEESDSDKLLNKLLITSKVKESKGKEIKEEKDTGDFVFLSPEVKDIFYEFIAHRKKREKGISQRAIDNLYSSLNKLSSDSKTQFAIIEQAIIKNRKSFYPLPDNVKTTTKTTTEDYNEKIKKQNEETEKRYLASLQNSHGTQ